MNLVIDEAHFVNIYLNYLLILKINNLNKIEGKEDATNK
jgi:hypothetical protein